MDGGFQFSEYWEPSCAFSGKVLQAFVWLTAGGLKKGIFGPRESKSSLSPFGIFYLTCSRPRSASHRVTLRCPALVDWQIHAQFQPKLAPARYHLAWPKGLEEKLHFAGFE